MAFSIINILLLFILSITLVSLIKPTLIKGILSFLLASLIVFELVSLFITGSFIDYKFYLHLNYRDISSMMNFFIIQILIVFTVLFILTYLIYFLSNKILNINLLRKKSIRFSIIAFTIVIMSFNDGVINSAYDFISIVNVDDIEFKDALNNFEFENYVTPDKLKVKKGKNIIVISLESFEKSFLRGDLAHLAPNLISLSKKWNYFDMKEVPGGGWTSGSLYVSLTGIPSYFNIQGNSIFQSSYYTHITSIGHVLQKAGYDLSYVIGDAEFSGTEDMLWTYQFKNIIDKRNFKKDYELSEGNQVHDKDLFNEAKLEVLSKKEENKPFAIFISTLSTHWPDGMYDKRMEDVISPKNSDLEFMIAAVDFMVEDFIQFLEKEDVLKNTIVYIYPDHIKMGDPSIFEGSEERSLYVLTNASIENLDVDTANTIYQIDLPKIILGGASVKHNASFLTDNIKGDKIKFINENRAAIVALNTSGLERINEDGNESAESTINPLIATDPEMVSEYMNDKNRFIAHAGGSIDGHTYTNSREALDHNHSKGFQLFELDIIRTSDGKYVAAHDWEHWKKITNYEGSLPPTEEEFLKNKIYGKYTPMNMDAINRWFLDHEDAILVTDKVNEPRTFAGLFIDKKRLMMELFTLDAVKEGLSSGIKSAMPSQNVIEKLGDQKAEVLIALGVKNIAISRRYILYNSLFLKVLKSNNIKTFIYHLNFNEGKDENYVIINEMDYIFGIYADNWEFPMDNIQIEN